MTIDSSTVEQSSDYNRHFVADLAIDGDNVTEFFGHIKGCSHTSPDNYNDYHWWRVMLHKPSVVSTVHYLYRNRREGKYRLQSTCQFAVLHFLLDIHFPESVALQYLLILDRLKHLAVGVGCPICQDVTQTHTCDGDIGYNVPKPSSWSSLACQAKTKLVCSVTIYRNRTSTYQNDDDTLSLCEVLISGKGMQK